jgi:hypothetical protein
MLTLKYRGTRVRFPPPPFLYHYELRDSQRANAAAALRAVSSLSLQWGALRRSARGNGPCWCVAVCMSPCRMPAANPRKSPSGAACSTSQPLNPVALVISRNRKTRTGPFESSEWSGRGSNPQPQHCERCALPIELPPRGCRKHNSQAASRVRCRRNRPALGPCFNTRLVWPFYGRLAELSRSADCLLSLARKYAAFAERKATMTVYCVSVLT